MRLKYENCDELGPTIDIIFGQVIVSISILHWGLHVDLKDIEPYVMIGCVTIGKY